MYKVSQEIFAKYDDLVSVLRDFVDNVEEMYIALEDLRMSGGNTLYILLSSASKDLFTPIIMFLVLNPYTEDVYGLGLMIPVNFCRKDLDMSLDEINKTAEKIGGMIMSFHECSIIIKEPEPGKDLRQLFYEIIDKIYNVKYEGMLKIIDYSNDLVSEIEDIYSQV
jgi:hypothetical protein